MEVWQKEHIRKNLDSLLENTQCNAIFLAKLNKSGILSVTEADLIKSGATDIDKADKLYDVIPSKVNGYSLLVKAYYETRQTGALRTLLDGYTEEGINDPLTQCAIQLNHTKILACQVEFHGRTLLFGNLFQTFLNEKLCAVYLNSIQDKDCLDYTLFGKNTFALAKNTLPPIRTYYIPRLISNRFKLDPMLFQQNCRDVFVFKGIDWYQLTNLAHSMKRDSTQARPNVTAVSSTQTTRISRKFILLESDGDLADMCVSARKQKLPLHVISFEVPGETEKHEGECILEESHGNSTVLWNFVCGKHEMQSCYITEQQFIERIESGDASHSRGFCICDSPGMGKTLVLESIAQQIAKLCPERLVVFINLSNFTAASSMTQDPLESALCRVCKSALGKSFLKMAITQGRMKMDLFLDGFDEVSDEKIDSVKGFMISISKSYQNIRLFVTSRPHKRRELENTLGVIAYDIFLFDKMTQVNYLVNFWKTKILAVDDKSIQLQEFAEALLNHVNNTFSPHERDIMGIPLQCFLLAKVNTKQAEKYSTRNHSLNTLLNCSNSIFDMFRDFLAEKFEKTNISTSLIKLKEYHICKAIETVVPEISEFVASALNVNVSNEKATTFKLGILEIRQVEYNAITVNFVHRTFAEYLVAEYFMDTLRDSERRNEKNLKILQFLLKYLLQTENDYKEDISFVPTFVFEKNIEVPEFQTSLPKFKFPVIIYFLNAFLSSIDQHSLDTIVEIDPRNLHNILASCARYNKFHVARFFMKSLEIMAENKFKQEYRMNLFESLPKRSYKIAISKSYALLCIASKFSDEDMVHELVRFYEQFNSSSLISICNKMPPWLISPLQYACEAGKYSLVEYFNEDFTFQNKSLLYYCIHGSIHQLGDRMELCKLLINKVPNILTEPCFIKSEYLEGPLVCSEVHFKILKMLVEKGAKILCRHVDNWGNTANSSVSLSAKYLPANLFHDFINFITCGRHLIEPNVSTRLDPIIVPHEILFYANNLESYTVNMILEGRDVCELDTYGNSLLHLAVLGNQSIDIVKMLVERGIDIKCERDNGENLLHLASTMDRMDLVEYFLAKGVPVNDKDNFGNTPLINAYSIQMIKYLVQNGADHILANESGETVLHKFTSYRYELTSKDIHNFFTFFLNKNGTVDILNSSRYNRPLLFSIIEQCYNLGKNTRDMILQACKANMKNCSKGFLDKAILEAMSSGSERTIRNELLTYGADYTYKTHDQDTLLHLAAQCGNLELTKFFTEQGLSVNDKGSKGNTPIQVTRSLQVIEHLLSRGADLSSVNNEGKTFVQIAAEWTNEAEFQQLVDILQKRFSNLKTFLSEKFNGETVAHSRLKSHPTDKYTLSLLENSLIDVNTTDMNGDTLLHVLASSNTNWELVKALSQGKANWKAKNNSGRNVLHIAAEIGNVNAVTYFSKLGLSVNERAIYGNTPIHLAYKHMHMVKHLRSMNANILVQNYSKESVLHLAAKFDTHFGKTDNFVELALHVLEECRLRTLFKESNVDKRSPIHQRLFNKGYTPIYLLKEILQVPWFDINKTDLEGNTMLHTAVIAAMKMENGTEIVKTLVDHGAEIDVTNQANKTPLHLAVEQRNIDIVNYLLSCGANVYPRDNWGNIPVDKFYLRHNDQYVFSKFLEEWTSTQILDVLLDRMNSKDMNASCDKYGNTFVHYAATEHFYLFKRISQWLVATEQLNILCFKNKRLQLPLHIAISREVDNSTIQVLQLLQSNGISVNTQDGKGRSLLHCSVSKELNPISARLRNAKGILQEANISPISKITMLIEAGVGVSLQNRNGNTFLHLLAKGNFYRYFGEVVKILKEKSNEKIIFIKNKKGLLPLHSLLKRWPVDRETLELLYNCGMDFNAVDRKSKSLLMYATANKGQYRVELLKWLIEYGADVMNKDHQGNTFLHYVSKYWAGTGYQKVLEHLVSNGHACLLGSRNMKNKTPLFIAVQYTPCTIDFDNVVVQNIGLYVKLLELQNNRLCDVNLILNELDHQGYSILACSLMTHQKLEIVKQLVSFGADWRYVNKKWNISVMHICARNGLIEHLKYFYSMGCQLDTVDFGGNSALHYAALYKWCNSYSCGCNPFKTIEFLCENGLNKHHLNKQGDTPFSFGMKYGSRHPRVMQALQ